LDLETSLQGELERAADKKLETLRRETKRVGAISNGSEEQNTFFFGMRVDKIAREEATLLNHVKTYAERQEDVVVPDQLLELFFCLPCDLKHEVRSIDTLRTITSQYAEFLSLTNPSAIADAGALGRLAVVFTIAGNLLATMVMPRFSRCHSPELLWKRFHQVLGLLISALSILVLAAWLFPEPMLWILGQKYQNLENEFLLMVIAQSLNCLLTAVSSLNSRIKKVYTQIHFNSSTDLDVIRILGKQNLQKA
jgi:hypothetical protein